MDAPDSPWASRDFRWLLAGRGVDALGNAMYPVGLGFGMLRLFDSVAAMGVVIGAGSMGMVFLLLAGGVLADRLPRRTVLVWSNVVAGVAQLAIVAMVVLDIPNLAAVVVLSFFTGAAAAFDQPASTALVPQTLTPATLHKGNGLLTLTRRGANIAGAATAGFLTALFGAATALAVNAATFFLAGVCFAMIRVRATAREPGLVTSPLADLREGWTDFRSRQWLVVVVAAFFVINGVWVGGFHLLGVVIAEEGPLGADGWGLVLAAEGVGGILGTLVAVRWRPTFPLRVGMLGAFASVLPMAVLAVAPTLVPLLLSSVIAGIGIMIFAVNWDTSMQRHVPADRLARVSSIDSIGSVAAIPVGSFLAGPLAAVVGVSEVVTASAVLAGVAALAALASPSVRNLE